MWFQAMISSVYGDNLFWKRQFMLFVFQIFLEFWYWSVLVFQSFPDFVGSLVFLRWFQYCKYSALGSAFVELPWGSWDAANLHSDLFLICTWFEIFGDVGGGE